MYSQEIDLVEFALLEERLATMPGAVSIGIGQDLQKQTGQTPSELTEVLGPLFRSFAMKSSPCKELNRLRARR
jgi:hypothetical protein